MTRYLDKLGSAVVGTLIILAIVFLLFPICVAVVMSFDGRSFLGPFPPSEFSLRWYDALLSNENYVRGFRTSVIVALLAAAGATIAGVSAAVLLDRYDFPAKEALAAFFFAPLIVPGVVIGFALIMYFGFLGIEHGFVRLLLGHLLISVPYTIRTTLASLVGIRRSLTEAAMSLGATSQQAFWDITFPLARTGIFAGALFALAFSFDDVPMSIFLSDTDSFTLPVALLGSMRSSFNLTIAAASMLLVAFTIGLIAILDRLVGVERIVGQGIYRS
jgi:putative spermidine/putrescine transport system permease protein